MSKPAYEGAYYIAAFKVTLAETAVRCRYYVMEGGNYESEDAMIGEWDTYMEMTDDQFITQIGDSQWTDIPEENYLDGTTAYIFVLKAYYDADMFTNMQVWGAKNTLIVMAQDDADVWGASGRKFFYISSPNEEYGPNQPAKGQVLGDVDELKSLVESLPE